MLLAEDILVLLLSLLCACPMIDSAGRQVIHSDRYSVMPKQINQIFTFLKK